jgi:hypothetical protein
MTRRQRELEREANRASRRAKKAPRGQKMRRIVLAFLARTEALKAGPVAR